MKIVVSKDAKALGERAADFVAEILKKCIAEKGSARIVLSTGASQFTTLEALVQKDVDWSKVEMFHLDEYVNLPETHPASFRKYLRERFIDKVHPGAAHLVDGSPESIADITAALREKPVDVGLIGIGENAHIAFNDPPADFDCEEAYKIVTLNADCRRQQLGEGWFKTLEDVPRQAVSMTVRQILKCRHIISAVPYSVKAQALYKTAGAPEITNAIPATALRLHPDVTVYADRDSAAKILESGLTVFEEGGHA